MIATFPAVWPFALLQLPVLESSGLAFSLTASLSSFAFKRQAHVLFSAGLSCCQALTQPAHQMALGR